MLHSPSHVTCYIHPPRLHVTFTLLCYVHPWPGVADPPGQVKGLHSETSGCITVVRWEPASAEQGGQVDSYDVMWGETEAGAFSTATIIYTSAPHQLTLPAVSRVALLLFLCA